MKNALGVENFLEVRETSEMGLGLNFSRDDVFMDFLGNIDCGMISVTFIDRAESEFLTMIHGLYQHVVLLHLAYTLHTYHHYHYAFDYYVIQGPFEKWLLEQK